MESDRSPELSSLTGLRAFAAWWVVFFHLKGLIFTLFPQLNFLLKVPLSTGYLGVDLFFILSGFIISYQYSSWFLSSNYHNYFRFLWKRIARVYPVHLVTLLLMVLVVLLSRNFGFEFSEHPWIWQEPDRFSFASFLANILLIHAWEIPMLATWNVVSWSLSCEWLAYVLFPFLVIRYCKVAKAGVGLSVIGFLLIGMALACEIVEFKGTPSYAILRIASEFSVGCIAFRLYQLGSGLTLRWEKITSFALIGVIVGGSLFTYFEIKAFWFTPLLVVLIYGLAIGKGIIAKIFRTGRMIYWGRVSYSLYMTHLLCIIILDNTLPLEWLAGSNAVFRISVIVGYLCAVGVIAKLTYHWIEEPCRKRLQKVSLSRAEASLQS